MSRPNSTVLHHAIATGDIDTLQILLKQGSVDADTRLQIDDDVLETASRKSLSSLRSYRQHSMTTNDLIVEEETCDGMATKKDLTIIVDQEEDCEENTSSKEVKEDENVFSNNVCNDTATVSYTHLTLPTTPYV